MKAKIIFKDGADSPAMSAYRKQVYTTVEHINSFHPVKITKVVIVGDAHDIDNVFVRTMLWCGDKYMSDMKFNTFDGEADGTLSILYAHLRASSKASKEWRDHYFYSTSLSANKNTISVSNYIKACAKADSFEELGGRKWMIR